MTEQTYRVVRNKNQRQRRQIVHIGNRNAGLLKRRNFGEIKLWNGDIRSRHQRIIKKRGAEE